MLYLCSLLEVFMVSCLMFKSLIHFDCIFGAWYEYVPSSLIYMQLSMFPAPLAEEIVFSPFYILASFEAKIDCRVVALFLGSGFFVAHILFCTSDTVWITLTFSIVLSLRVMPPALFFSPQDCFDSSGFLLFR